MPVLKVPKDEGTKVAEQQLMCSDLTPLLLKHETSLSILSPSPWQWRVPVRAALRRQPHAGPGPAAPRSAPATAVPFTAPSPRPCHVCSTALCLFASPFPNHWQPVSQPGSLRVGGSLRATCRPGLWGAAAGSLSLPCFCPALVKLLTPC